MTGLLSPKSSEIRHFFVLDDSRSITYAMAFFIRDKAGIFFLQIRFGVMKKDVSSPPLEPPKPLPVLNLSNLVEKKGFPVVTRR